jgi:hypothetical protein
LVEVKTTMLVTFREALNRFDIIVAISNYIYLMNLSLIQGARPAGTAGTAGAAGTGAGTAGPSPTGRPNAPQRRPHQMTGRSIQKEIHGKIFWGEK